jgi:hypothetical protein
VVELNDLSSGTQVAVGERGEVLVPSDRARPDGSTGGARPVPEHPPWQEPVGPWAPGKPLLAPARSPDPEDRAPELRGRLFTRYEYTEDRQGSGREYQRSWTGLDLDYDNLFGRAGQVRFRGDVSYRDFISGSNRADETFTRIQRLSYREGLSIDDPHRIEFGRFLHSEFPQFGLIDGAEYVHRFSGGSRLGASFGMLPDGTDELDSSDDVAASLFYRWASNRTEALTLGAGYQKSWHRGEADRDLLAGTLDWAIGEFTDLRASALVDYHDSTAVIESEGFQLTDLNVFLGHRFENQAGVSVFASHTDWPELLRDEFPVPPPETIADQRVSRAGVRGWKGIAEGVRLHARVEGWQDLDREGGNAELRCDLRDVLYDGGELSVAVQDTEGAYTSGLGGRVRLTHWFDRTTLRLEYDLMNFEQDGFFGDQRELLQHWLRAGLDTALAEDLDLSLHANRGFGDEQDSLTAGLRLQWRF